MDPNKFSPNQKKEFEAFLRKTQIQDSIRLYNSLVERCFHGCVNDFTTQNLSDKEEDCLLKCSDKFVRVSSRVIAAFQQFEEQSKAPV